MNFVEEGKLLTRLWDEYAESQKRLKVEIVRLRKDFGSAMAEDNSIRTLFDDIMGKLSKEHWANSLYSEEVDK